MKTAEEIVNQTIGWKVISVTRETTVKKAIEVMVKNKIGAILIKEKDEIFGIWTERDLMRNCLLPDFNIETSMVGEFMTTEIVKASIDDNIFQLMDKFLGLHVRHLLIENDDGEFVGLLSLGDVIKFQLNEKTEELKSINSVINWDYYENWHW